LIGITVKGVIAPLITRAICRVLGHRIALRLVSPQRLSRWPFDPDARDLKPA
jgi:hypothetical protein